MAGHSSNQLKGMTAEDLGIERKEVEEKPTSQMSEGPYNFRTAEEWYNEWEENYADDDFMSLNYGGGVKGKNQNDLTEHEKTLMKNKQVSPFTHDRHEQRQLQMRKILVRIDAPPRQHPNMTTTLEPTNPIIHHPIHLFPGCRDLDADTAHFGRFAPGRGNRVIKMAIQTNSANN